MSRIGKMPIVIPAGVNIALTDGQISVTGPKGELKQAIHHRVKVANEDQKLVVTVKDPNNQGDRALWGLTRALLANMVIGVTAGFTKKLEINGIGYRAQVNGQTVVLNLGFSHQIDFPLPAGITAQVDKNIVSISGTDKQLVGETAAKIRALKKPEPYKGKGIKYEDETIRRKAGKVIKAAGAK
jgi:large subunit ribosomal protein L6